MAAEADEDRLRRLKLEELRLAAAILRKRRTNRLAEYRPYPKQAEFHAAGARFRERMLKAGNQQGKTYSAGAEVAMHLTGVYPDWWQGRRWQRPVAGWAAGVTSESTRDNPQRILLGRIGQLGTGTIPLAHLDPDKITSSRGVADAVDTVLVKHISGGWSTLQFKSYEKGREKWQGDTLDLVWFDEEPDEDIYTEGLTRTNATGGMVLITYTPLLGMSRVTVRFIKEKSPDRHVTNMTINDAEHYSPEERAAIIASYPAHEREARVNGVPMMGSGRIFPLSKEAIQYDASFAFPPYFRRILGWDFGWDHPSAGAWLAHDPDADVVYVYDAYRVAQKPVIEHAAAIRARGAWIPVAWPADGLQHEKGAGVQLAQQYRDQGINMLPDHATFERTGAEHETQQSLVSVEAGVSEMLERMQTGRLKVASHLNDWFEEFLLYHREDGKIVKEIDDLMSATRYGIMMLRHAKAPQKKHMPESWRERLKARSRGRGSPMTA